MGNNQTFSISSSSCFGQGFMVQGAFLEDHYDVVYHYGIHGEPNFNQFLLPDFIIELGLLFSPINPFTTITHFWDADQGDDYQSFLWGEYSGIYFSFSCENALQKIKLYKNGNYNCRYFYNDPPVQWFIDPTKMVVGFDFKYNSLVDLYKTGRFYVPQYLDYTENWFAWNENIEYIWSEEYRKKYSYELLGRMAHLLTDMGVPCHAHSDCHLELEFYEDNMNIFQFWTAQEIYSQGERYIDPYVSSDPLRFLTYIVNQVADHYASDDFDGDDFYNSSNEYSMLNSIIPNLGLPQTTAQINIFNLNSMHNHLLPFVIRATAGLFYWFAVETGQLVPVTIKNDFEFGQIMVDLNQVNSPFKAGWIGGSNHSFGAIDQNYQAPGQANYFHEFDRWDLPEGRTNFNRTFNENVYVGGDYLVKTKRRFNYNTSNNFINGSSNPGFLKINEQIVNLPCSSYVREGNQIKTEAPPQQQMVNGKTINYNFLQWNSGPLIYDNPRTFFPDDHFTVQPDYKGHLVTGSSIATGYSSSRKIVTLPATKWHMVYEDNQSIFYTTSTDGGASWIPEIQINVNDQIPSKSPCIEVQRAMPDEDNSHMIGVVWDQEYNYQENLLHRPVFRYKVGINSNTWSDELIWGSPSQHTSVNCRPVLAGTWYMDRDLGVLEERFYFLCKSISGLALLRNGKGSLMTWLNPFPGSGSNCNNPTITSTKYRDIDKDNLLFFCWDQNGEIRYSYYNVQTADYPSSPEILASASSFNLNSKPCISYDDDKNINVVWEHFNGVSQTTIQHRKKVIGSGWEPIREISCYGHNLFNPSVGAYKSSEEGELILSAKMTPASIQSFHFDGSEWEIMSESKSEGDYACLNDADSKLLSVWTNSTMGLPYLIENYSFSSEELVRESRHWLKRKSRRIEFDLSEIKAMNLSGEVVIEIDSLKVSTNQGTYDWSFIPLDDSLINNRFFYSVPMTVTPEINNLTVFYSIKLQNYNLPSISPTVPFLRFQLGNNQNLQPLLLLSSLSFTALPSGSFTFQDSITVSVKSFVGKSVYFSLTGVFDLLRTEKKNLVEKTEFYNGLAGELQKEVLSETIASMKKVPGVFMLAQNYPNPFNPSTTIAFDLSKDVFVSLQIFDIAGREICTLVNEPREAGTHQVIWDGQDDRGTSVASGVYIYRLQAGDFVQSRKMLFMK